MTFDYLRQVFRQLFGLPHGAAEKVGRAGTIGTRKATHLVQAHGVFGVRSGLNQIL